MNLKENWLSASIFFLAGCTMYSVAELVRGHLYAAQMTRSSWSYPDPLIEGMAPAYLRSIAVVAFILSGVAIVVGTRASGKQ